MDCYIPIEIVKFKKFGQETGFELDLKVHFDNKISNITIVTEDRFQM